MCVAMMKFTPFFFVISAGVKAVWFEFHVALRFKGASLDTAYLCLSMTDFTITITAILVSPTLTFWVTNSNRFAKTIKFWRIFQMAV